jgi:hypothetical protein
VRTENRLRRVWWSIIGSRRTIVRLKRGHRQIEKGGSSNGGEEEYERGNKGGIL